MHHEKIILTGSDGWYILMYSYGRDFTYPLSSSPQDKYRKIL